MVVGKGAEVELDSRVLAHSDLVFQDNVAGMGLLEDVLTAPSLMVRADRLPQVVVLAARKEQVGRWSLPEAEE